VRRTERGFAALVFAAAFVAFAMSDLAAANLDLKTLTSVPIRYYAGDEVVMQASITPDSGEKLAPLDLTNGSGLRAQADEAETELRELKLAKTPEGWLLSVRFVPWSPGSGTIPEMKLKAFRIPSLPYKTGSLLGPEDRDPSPPRPQRDLPGIAGYFYGFAGILVVLALAVAFAALYLFPAARALLAKRRAAHAYKRFCRTLDYLAVEAASAESGGFLAALIRALRLYLSERVRLDACALTAPELAALPDAAFPLAGARDKAAALVARADRMRYGHELSKGVRPESLLKAEVDEARAIGAAIEEALLADV
jgi:hypothetical protein